MYNKLRKEFVKPSFRKRMVKELGESCVNCGSSHSVEYHHIVPLVNGGTNRMSNIVPLCETCHYKAHDRHSFNSKNGGRPALINYEEAKPVLHRYFNLEIGMKEAKKLLGMSPATKSSWYKLTKLYKEEYHISNNFRNPIDLLNAQLKRLESVNK